MIVLRSLRRSRSATRRQCADQFGVSVRTWERWEEPGKLPPADQLKPIADFFEVTVDSLLEGDKSRIDQAREAADVRAG